MDHRDRISIDPARRSGKPCIKGTRMTVTDVVEYLASGMSHEEILSDFPYITEEDIRACQMFAADGEQIYDAPQTLQGISEAVEEIKEIKAGRKKGRPLKDLLDEL